MQRVPSAQPDPAAIRLLIADDHTLFCAGLVQLFRGVSAIADLATAGSLHEAVQVGRLFQPHVVLLDAGLLDGAPADLTGALQWACGEAKWILLDNAVCEHHVRQALQMRAQGYWTKHVSFDQLTAAVLQVASGQPAFCPAVEPHLSAARGATRPGSSTA